jgi:tRNA-dihydrouridine synthase A
VPLKVMARHLLGLYYGEPGGRQFRRALSETAHRSEANGRTILRALATVGHQPRREAAE